MPSLNAVVLKNKILFTKCLNNAEKEKKILIDYKTITWSIITYAKFACLSLKK